MAETRKAKGGQARDPDHKIAGCKWYKGKVGKAGGILIFTKAYVIS